MPYIKDYRRRQLMGMSLKEIIREAKEEALLRGEFNYVISAIVNGYLCGDVHYARINDVVGVLECAKLELYRRVAANHEDKKMAENGDVYTCG